MIDTISALFRSPYWPILGGIIAGWGLLGLLALVFGVRRTPRARAFVWTGIALMAASVALSMAFENYLPNWHNMDPTTRATRGFGLAGIFLGTVAFAAGGIVLARALLDWIAAAPPKRRGRAAAPPPRPAPPRPKVRPGGMLMLLGTVLFFLGASLRNPNRFPLAWFWALFGL